MPLDESEGSVKGKDKDNDSSMRTSRRYGMRERPFNPSGLACADQGHPRAALDENDFQIRLLRPQHPVQSYRNGLNGSYAWAYSNGCGPEVGFEDMFRKRVSAKRNRWSDCS